MKMEAFITLGNLAFGQTMVIDQFGNVRMLKPGEIPKPGELLLSESAQEDTDVQASIVGVNGNDTDISDDVSQIFAALEQGADPTQLNNSFATAAGEDNGSSISGSASLARNGDETMAETRFTTLGFKELGVSTEQFDAVVEQVSFFSRANSETVEQNLAPVAQSQAIVTREDQSYRGKVEATDGNNDQLSYQLDANNGPSHGQVSIDENGNWTYTPNADYNGSDKFQIQVSDGKGGTDTVTVDVDVLPVAVLSVTTEPTIKEAQDAYLPFTITLDEAVTEDVLLNLDLGIETDLAKSSDDYSNQFYLSNGAGGYDAVTAEELIIAAGDKELIVYVKVSDDGIKDEHYLESLTLEVTSDSLYVKNDTPETAMSQIIDDNPPEAKDFSVKLNSDGFASIQFNSTNSEHDKISDNEDDLFVEKKLEIVITELPATGTLYYGLGDERRAIVEEDLAIFDESGKLVDGTKFDPTKFTYQNEGTFVLGVKDTQTDLKGDESKSSFLNWGEPVAGDPSIRVLRFDDSDDVITIRAELESGKETTLMQYLGDKNHVGYGLGVGRGDGIQEGESIVIDFSQRPADSVTLGLDGMGGWFYEGHDTKATKVIITVTLDNGEVLTQDVTKTTTGNRDLFHEITFPGPSENIDASITSVKVSTSGPGNWELRYLETELKDESFDYRVLDSDGNFSEEAQVDIKIADNKPPIAIDDPTSFEVRLGTFNTDNNLRWSDDGVASISTRYGIDGISDNVNENTLKQGVSNDVNGGPAPQIQYNSENGKSEEFVIELNGYVDNFSFSVSNLFLNEGGSNSHEQGRWTTYDGDRVVDTGVFIANDGSNKGIYHIEDLTGFFNKIVFDAVEYTGGVPKGSDSSDYFITGFQASSIKYSGFEGQVIAISIAELLRNDYDPDGDDIRLTHVSEVSDGAKAWIDGDYVKVQLPEGVDEISFKYQITDDKGLVSSSDLIEATVKVEVNAVEIRQQGDTVISYHDFNQVEYKESNSKNWEHIKADDVKFLEGSTGKWGTESKNFEVGDHAVYGAKDPDDDKHKVLELEADEGDNNLYTQFSAEQGQFLTLSFDVVARRLHDSPMKITLQDTQGNQIGADIYTYQPSKEWKAESISFQIPSDANYNGDYRIVFESSETDSYGALLDNIELKTLNNVGFEAQSFPLADITFSTDLHAGITNDDLEVRVRLNNLPSGSKFILGEQTFTDLDQDGWVELGTLTDLSNLRLEVGEEGAYHFTVEVLHQNEVVAKSDDIEVNVLDASLSPLASEVQIATNGDDLLEATTDSDILVGLDGSDTFSWDFEALSSVNADTIKDFELGEDIIDLSELFSSGETMDDILSSVVSDDGDVILTVDASKGASSASQEIRLEGLAEQANYLDANAGEISGDQLSRLLNDITNTTP